MDGWIDGWMDGWMDRMLITGVATYVIVMHMSNS